MDRQEYQRKYIYKKRNNQNLRMRLKDLSNISSTTSTTPSIQDDDHENNPAINNSFEEFEADNYVSTLTMYII